MLPLFSCERLIDCANTAQHSFKQANLIETSCLCTAISHGKYGILPTHGNPTQMSQTKIWKYNLLEFEIPLTRVPNTTTGGKGVPVMS